jgi:aerobic-type carbon monoxide dehydrogenase small subunit (CoxS/CutS family)
MADGDSEPDPLRFGQLRVNGRARSVRLEPSRSLLEVVRDEWGLTGTKYGCGEGVCGACQLLVDDIAVRACITPIGEVVGRSVTTIEGLAENGRLTRVQQAFLDEGAFQCGYCTPGMIVAATALLAQNPRPSDAEIRSAMQGNICRCGGYLRIQAAVRRAAGEPPVTRSGAP